MTGSAQRAEAGGSSMSFELEEWLWHWVWKAEKAAGCAGLEW